MMDVWLHHRGYPEKAREDLKVALCAVLFNAQGLLYNLLLERMKPQNCPGEERITDPSLPCGICGGDYETGHQRLCPVEIERSRTETFFDPDDDESLESLFGGYGGTEG
jgi:hypothetical protein